MSPAGSEVAIGVHQHVHGRRQLHLHHLRLGQRELVGLLFALVIDAVRSSLESRFGVSERHGHPGSLVAESRLSLWDDPGHVR